MHLEPAEPATTRRSLIRAAGAAGIAGAAALLASRPVSATPAPEPPGPADVALLEQAMLLELTARDLYLSALASDVGDLGDLVTVLAENHESYAQSIAGVAGLSAQGRNDAVFEALQPGFTADFAVPAHQLEQTAVATHTQLVGEYESQHAIELTASIIVVEARHATVLADVAGVSDLDVVFGNEQSALELAQESI